MERFETPYGRDGWLHPRFVGDVDGDGYDDLAMLYPDKDETDFPCFVLVYGGPEGARIVGNAGLEGVRHTKVWSTLGWPSCWYGSLVGAGDVDGDGIADLLKSYLVSWEDVSSSGLVVLVYGKPDMPGDVQLEDTSSVGLRSARFIAREVDASADVKASTRDLNGDGFDDVAIRTAAPGTVNGGEGAGRLDVFYGGPHLQGDIDLSEVGQRFPGFRLQAAIGRFNLGEPFDSLGGAERSLTSASDVNGDGFQDLAVGAFGAWGGRGAVYLLLGGPTLDGVTRLKTAEPGGPLVEIIGEDGMNGGLGGGVNGLGDVDGDGYADILAGAYFGNRVYVIYGMPSWPSRVAIGDPGLRVFTLEGRRSLDGQIGAPLNAYIGYTNLGIGDWDLDGYGDFLVGAAQQEIRFEEEAGEVFLVYGGPHLSGTASVHDVGRSLRGIDIVGDGAHSWLGHALEAGGDLDGDGRDDFLITARYWYGDPSPFQPLWPSYVYAFYGGRRGGGLAAHTVRPADGSIEGGYEVSICGEGFEGTEEVLFAGVSSARVEVATSAELLVEAPAGAIAGPVDVVVRRGAEETILPGAFRYVDAAAYSDIALDPEALRASGRRVLVYRDTPWPPPGFQVGQFMTVFSGDLNGDGRDDLLVGEPRGGDERFGQLSVIFGSRELPDQIGLRETRQYGTVIQAESTRWNLGAFVAFPGDLDGDGRPDLALGGATDPDAIPSSLSGASYVLFGRDEWPEVMRLDEEIAAGTALSFLHSACGQSRVAGPGDLDGDGRPDILLGYYPGCYGEQSAVRIHFGEFSPGGGGLFPPVIITGDPTPIVIPDALGSPYARIFGAEVSGAGDMNGDGLADFLVGAEHPIGMVYLILGGPWDFVGASITEFVETGRAVLLPYEHQGNWYGLHTAGIGDFNGDGLDDAAVGAPSGGRDYHGGVFVVLGSREFGTSVREVNVLYAGKEEVVGMFGEYGYDSNAYVEALGDVNGDGLSDIGITGSDIKNARSRAYVVFGSRDPPSRIDLSHLGTQGFRLVSKEGNWLSGFNGGIASGDFDSDGRKDLAVAEATPDGRRVVVVFGDGSGKGIFLRGDANRDTKVDIADALSILAYLFLGDTFPPCFDAADADDGGTIDITDALYILGYLFLGTAAPPPPLSEPGTDPTADPIGCLGF